MPRKPNISNDPAELRRRAEARLPVPRKGQRSKARQQTSAADAQRTLHELEVHQIELEMQNDELQKTRDELEVALEKYTNLYNFAPVGYFSIDESGVIQEMNLTGAVLLGIEKPTPSLPPDWVSIMELMPTTSPRMSMSGPPELPGLMAASVCK